MTETTKYGKRIGEGTFGTVYLKDSTVTKVSKDSWCYSTLKDICFTTLIPFAVKPINYSFNDEGKIIVQFPYMGGCAYKKLPTASIDAKKDAIAALLERIIWLHENGILHNDLMTDNILYNGKLHLIDWGLANLDIGMRYDTYCNHFKSPENKARATQSTADDMWAVGVLILEIFNGYKINTLTSDMTEKDMPITPEPYFSVLRKQIFVPAVKRLTARKLFEALFPNRKMATWPKLVLHEVDVNLLPTIDDYDAKDARKESIAYLFAIQKHFYMNDTGIVNAWNLVRLVWKLRSIDKSQIQLLVLICCHISNDILGNTPFYLDELAEIYKKTTNDTIDIATTAWLRSILLVISPHYIVGPLPFPIKDAKKYITL